MNEVLTLIIIGILAGVMSGILGIGGGIIVIPALVMVLGYSQQAAQGTSLGLLLPPVGILAVINYYNKGFVNVKAVIIMAIAFLIGSYFSSKFATELPEAVLKKIFAVFLVFYAAKLFFGK
ncbi:MAG TPA: sulfite exporter TauE/SafE family protein [Melioribacteraceae bacterium]|nr:sulfite exporter TauE/SafE family protein [Melioribacteraceae bacterium]